MAKNKVIWVDGERELFINMQRSMDGSLKAARKGMQKAGLEIIADAVSTIRDEGMWTTGKLASSGKVQKVEGDDDAIDVGFFSKDGEGYAAFVEYGRKAGKMPPVDDIKQWLRKKNRTRSGTKNALSSAAAFMGRKVGDYVTSLAWAIAKTIARKGTQPHPFFRPAVERHEKQIEQVINNAVKQSIK